MRTFKQPSESFGPFDPGAPRVAPDVSTPARAAAVRVEDEIRRDLLETGVLFSADGRELLRRQGAPDQVTYSSAELSSMRGATFSHNHPGGSGPSVDDVLVGAFANLKELRVVTSNARFLVTGLDQVWEGAIPVAHGEEQRAAFFAVKEWIRMGQVHPSSEKAEILHLTWLRVAKRLGFGYSLELS